MSYVLPGGIPGGNAEKEGKKPSDFSAKEVDAGRQVEREHTDDPAKATDITLDHLTEIPDYYRRLLAMERQADREGMKHDVKESADVALPPILLFVRHGSTKFNSGEGKTELLRGWLDVPLDETGEEEAHNTAEKLSAYPIAVIVSSDLKRAADTARAIQEHNGAELRITQELRPWDLGSLAGKPVDETHQKLIKLIEHGLMDAPGGESFNEFRDRCIKEYRKLMAAAEQIAPGGCVCAVTHTRNIRLLLGWLRDGMGDDAHHAPMLMEEDPLHTGDILLLIKQGNEWTVAHDHVTPTAQYHELKRIEGEPGEMISHEALPAKKAEADAGQSVGKMLHDALIKATEGATTPVRKAKAKFSVKIELGEKTKKAAMAICAKLRGDAVPPISTQRYAKLPFEDQPQPHDQPVQYQTDPDLNVVKQASVLYTKGMAAALYAVKLAD
jgi:probable phosphoglycerate mutase